MRVDPVKRRRRSVGLTPLIDVVFLLLVFFMLASQLGSEALLPLEIGAGSAALSPEVGEVIELRIEAGGALLFGAEAIELPELRTRLGGPENRALPLHVVPDPEATLQRISEVLDVVQQSGHEQTALVEPKP